MNLTHPEAHCMQRNRPSLSKARFVRPLAILLGTCATLTLNGITQAQNDPKPQLRIVNYNIADLAGDHDALRIVFESIAIDITPETGVIRAPDIYVFQEVPSNSLNTLEFWLDASAPANVDYRRATFTSNGGGGDNALFYRVDAIVEDQAGHRDIFNHTGPRPTDRWKLAFVEDEQLVFYVYGSHFKADTGSQNESRRASEADAIRNDADALGTSAFAIFAGDWNVYTPSEQAFQRFFDSGNAQSVDPRFNGVFSTISHTQSPHDGSNGQLVAGGMDDRFDFQLMTQELDDGVGFDVIAESYRSFGNDGQHFNQPINNGSNSYFAPSEQWRADALALASDHLPVVVDYVVPINRLALSTGPLIAGIRADFFASGALPNTNVYFIYSLRGTGSTYVSQLSVTLSLRMPALLGQDRADNQGRAHINPRIPVEALGRIVWIQAAQVGAVSDVVYRFIE